MAYCGLVEDTQYCLLEYFTTFKIFGGQEESMAHCSLVQDTQYCLVEYLTTFKFFGGQNIGPVFLDTVLRLLDSSWR